MNFSPTCRQKPEQPVPGSEIVVKSRSVKRNAKNATAPFLKSRASYFRFARFNTSALYYLRAWHRLKPERQCRTTIYCQRNSIFHRAKKIIIFINLTGQNRGLSGLKNIWPVIMTGDLLSVILSLELPSPAQPVFQRFQLFRLFTV